MVDRTPSDDFGGLWVSRTDRALLIGETSGVAGAVLLLRTITTRADAVALALLGSIGLVTVDERAAAAAAALDSAAVRGVAVDLDFTGAFLGLVGVALSPATVDIAAAAETAAGSFGGASAAGPDVSVTSE